MDTPTIEEVYRLHYNKVFSVCFSMLKDRAEAEDLAHDVFVVLMKKLDSFEGRSQLRTWLHRVTVNQVLMYVRKRNKTTHRTDYIEDLEGESYSEFPSHAHFSPGARIDMETAINNLPQGYRSILLLHDVEGHPHSEIAEILGITPGTAKSQLHKGRRAVLKLLNRKRNPRARQVPETQFQNA